MNAYTVHEKPTAAPVLVREAFSWGALLFGPLWLLSHRAWLAALAALVVFVAIGFAPPPWRGIPMAGAMILLGLIGRDLQRWSLARRGYALVHVVAGRNADEAYLRLMDHRDDVGHDEAVV